jgi:hypothetical protein
MWTYFKLLRLVGKILTMPRKLNASGEYYSHHNMISAKRTLLLNPWCYDIKFSWCNTQSSPMASME